MASLNLGLSRSILGIQFNNTSIILGKSNQNMDIVFLGQIWFKGDLVWGDLMLGQFGAGAILVLYGQVHLSIIYFFVKKRTDIFVLKFVVNQSLHSIWG